MYRLTVVAGPGRGTSFKLSEGENTVGRQLGNTVVLPSAQVSKRHCVLIASGGELVVRDQGSSNGTFVNGMLAKNRKVAPGDRIGVGDFVLQLSGSSPRPPEANVIELASHRGGSGAFPLAQPMAPLAGAPALQPQEGGEPAIPKDLKGKASWYFENYLMPVFYGLNLKNEWRWICAAVFACFLALNLVISVQPLLNANRASIMRETLRRASFMARDIAERNAPLVGGGAETKTEIGIANTAEGVELAVLTDLDLRIIAPAQRMNQYLTAGAEARYASRISREFRKGREAGAQAVDDGMAVAIEPMKIYDPKKGKNVVIGMAIVSIDSSLATLGTGDAAVVYSETLILTALLGALMLFVLYRLTLKPFQVLNEDMDKALKGETAQVTHEFRMEELDPLWDLIGSALQRIPRSSNGQGGSELTGVGGDDGKPEQFVSPLRMLAGSMGIGIAICGADRKIAFMNEMFEELIGIRADTALGHEFSEVGRDQSLGVLAQDLFDRATLGGDGVSEDYEFSGISCRVMAAAFGAAGDVSARSYVLAVVKRTD